VAFAILVVIQSRYSGGLRPASKGVGFWNFSGAMIVSLQTKDKPPHVCTPNIKALQAALVLKSCPTEIEYAHFKNLAVFTA
jgi:hypothetical protein